MGQTYLATCNDCGRKSKVRIGGGFFFIQVRCQLCGKVKELPVEEHKDRTKLRAEGFGNCKCDGSFTEDALPRCPHCQSDNLDLGEPKIYYD